MMHATLHQSLVRAWLRPGSHCASIYRCAGSALTCEALEQRTMLASISWDGGGDGASWSDPANWSSDVLPAASDHVDIGHGATVFLGGKGQRIRVASLNSTGSLTLRGGSLRTTSGLNLNGTVSLEGNSTLRAGGEIRFTGSAVGNGLSLQILAPEVTVGDDAALDGLKMLRIRARAELWFGGEAHGQTLLLDGRGTARTVLTGTLDASTSHRRDPVGQVEILGADIYVQGALIDVCGPTGAGKVRIGGELGGGGTLPRAQRVYFDKNSAILADARRLGDGGNVIIWSDQHTIFEGSISASGGRRGGNGGFIETSAKGILNVGHGIATAAATRGQGGQWLMDPYDVTIANGANDNAVEIPGDPTTFLLFGSNAFIGVAGIVNALNTGTSVTITTFSGGMQQAGNIDVINAINKTTGADATLTLQAANSISIASSITSSSGRLNMVLQANTGADDLDTATGSVTMASGGLNTNGGSLSISGTGVSLSPVAGFSTAGGMLTIASMNGMSLNGTISAGTGGIEITATGDNISADTNMTGASAVIAALTGSVQVTQISVAGTIDVTAATNLTLGSGFGGGVVADELNAAAGTSGVGTLSFGSFMNVNADTIHLRSGDGPLGGATASVNALTNNPVFRASAGGATSPLSFEIRQDAALLDASIPGPARFGSGAVPASLTYTSDDGDVSVSTAAKVAGSALTLGSRFGLALGSAAPTFAPSSISFNLTPTGITLLGDVQTSLGDLVFPAAVTVENDSTLISAAAVTFLGTVNGASTLVVNAPGLKSFGSSVGLSFPLTSLTTTGGPTQLSGDVTAAMLSFQTSVITSGILTIRATSTGPAFASTLDIGAGSLSIVSANPEFSGGANSVSGTGTLAIAPATNGANVAVGGAGFVSTVELAAFASGFSNIEFGSPSHTGTITVNASTFQNPTRIRSLTGQISCDDVTVTGGGGFTLQVSFGGSIFFQGDSIRTGGGPIFVDGPVSLETTQASFVTTDSGAVAGANILFTGLIRPGDGWTPSVVLAGGATGVVELTQGLGTEFERIESLLVLGGPNGAVRTAGSIWLGSTPGTGFFTESPFELEADLTITAAAASFFNGIRSFGSPRSLDISCTGDIELHAVDLGGLNVTSIGGVVTIVENIDVDNTCLLDGDMHFAESRSISAQSLQFLQPVDLNGRNVALIADYLNLSGDIFGGGGVSTLTIAPRSAGQIISLNDTDSGLWLPASDLARITDGLALLIFGRLDGTSTLYIGSTTFSDPVEFRMAGPGGAIELNGPLNGTDNASFTFVGSGSTLTLNGNITTQSEPIVFSDAVEIGAVSVSISTTGGESAGAPITFVFRLDSQSGEANSLNLSAGIGNVVFESQVGGQPGGELGTLFINSGGGSTLLNGGLIRSTGNQSHLRDILLGASATIEAGSATITLIGAVACGSSNLLLRADDIEILAPISGSAILHISPYSISRDIYINISPLGPGGALTIDPSEKDEIQDGFSEVIYGQEGQMSSMVVGSGDYSDPTTFVENGGAGTSTISVAGEITGTDNGSIKIRGGGSTTHLFGSILTFGNTIDILDSIILHIPGLMLDSTYGGDFPSGAAVKIDGTVNSEAGEGNSFELQSGFAELRLMGAIGAALDGRLGSLTINTLGQTILTGGVINTIGFQFYAGPVLVPVDLVLSTLNAPITFEGEVTGDENLTIDGGSGETSFNEESSFESLTIEFGSTRAFNAPVTIGTLTILGGTVYFNSPGLITSGTLVSGILSGDDNASFNGEFSWQGGSIEGDGLIIILPTGVFELSTSASRTLARGIQVLGRMHWAAGNLALDDASLEVLPGGVLEVSSSGTVTAAAMSTGGLINNGRIERTTPGAGAFVGIAIINNGEIDISAGSIKFTPLSGLFTNDGSIALGPAGSLIVRGEFAQSAVGSLTIRIAGTGIAEFGRLLVINGANLDGNIATDFVEGFIPEDGDEFQFLSAETRSGTFRTQNLESPGIDLVSSVEYLANGARLVIAPQFMVDFDGDGERTVADIFAFLSSWFAGNGDFNHDGETTVADIFSYLSAWFAG